jgi:hypothetical protein
MNERNGINERNGVSERMAQRKSRTRRGPGWGFVVGNTVALAATTTVAIATLWPVYESREFVTLVAAAFGIGAGIAILGFLFRWPSYLIGILTVVAYLIAGVPLAIPGLAASGILPSADGFTELLAATAMSWKQLVTVVLPVGAYQSLLVPALILVLLSTVIGLSTALRARTGELAVLAPIALFLAGIALGPAVESSSVELGIAVFVSVLFWLLWLRWQRRRSAVRLVAQQSRGTIESAGDRRLGAARGLVSAAVIIAIAITVGTAAALAAPASEPRDVVRSRIQQPFDPRNYPSPLSAFRSYLQPETADTVLLSVDGLPAGARVRLAALDTYDGIVYSVGSDSVDSASGSFTRLPFRLDQSAVEGTPVSLQVTVGGYSGVWVPGGGRLERIRFTGVSAAGRADSFFYNDNSGTGAVLGGLKAGDTYESRSVVPRTVDDLAGLRPGTAVLPPVDVVPAGLTNALDGYIRASDAPGVRLQSTIDGLRAEGYISHGTASDEPVSRSGHGADRIAQLFTERPMVGDQEQYAVAAALMARQLGFPARVVVGFVPKADGGTGRVEVMGRDISAWIEVQTADGTWVTVDPNPPLRDVPAKLPDEPTVVSRPQTVIPPAPQDTTEQRELTQPDSTHEDPPAPIDPVLAFLLTVLGITGWALLGLAVLLAPFLAVIVAKLRRRRLRRSGRSPNERIRGGWREFQDAAVDYGIDAPVTATRTEFAETVGGTRSMFLASVVDRAVFAPGEPSADDAERVWRAVGDLRTSLADGRTRRERLAALISLRSFGRYAGTRSRRTRKGRTDS